MTLDAKEYKYAVVHFLQQPCEGIGEFVCIPHSWIRIRRVDEEQSIVAYPNERPSVTQRRVMDGEPPSEKWAVHLAVVRHETYNFDDAKFYILEKKYGVAAEDLCTFVGNRNNTLTKRPLASESKRKESAVEKTAECSSSNKISAENTSNVPTKDRPFVYSYLQRIPDLSKDASENGLGNFVRNCSHLSPEFLISMKQHLLESSNQSHVINTKQHTAISKVAQGCSQVQNVSVAPSVAEPTQVLHGSRDSEIQPMILDEPEENEDTVNVSSARDYDNERSSSPGVSIETDQPVGYPTERIRTQANFVADILEKMEKSELNSSEGLLEIHKSFERSIELVKRIRESYNTKKMELNKEKPNEVDTPDVEMRNDVQSSSNDDRDEDEARKAPEKPRNLRKFVLPPDHNADDTRWTLKYRENDPELGLEELIPGSKVYINTIRLAHCLRVAKDCKTLARMLLAEIFSKSALSVCSLTGAKANAFHNNGTYVRPGLDKHAMATMLKYVERHSVKEKWTTYVRQSVVNSIRSRVQEIRVKHAPK